jgi:hypothetical protein
MKPSSFCSDCLDPCETVSTYDKIDCWIYGTSGTHREYGDVSNCCGERIYTRHELAVHLWRTRAKKRRETDKIYNELMDTIKDIFCVKEYAN